ncbi:uncharacterized protein N0V89_002535 [Didymosphaeria variabile]|uniref:Uncharacterized protein n=1 Tax=Didymosphaeria variabile TaxID=1932322 RepID=A0A9W8XTP5_9PLEO|nr:uncharacterized protein N0V89_002535 [Didymosphaeria variabile]KAJ4357958.1 hypothetical protein N0V89_002535 [Didymosphaeria variabile]
MFFATQQCGMDIDGVPPPVRRAPREVLELQKAIDDFHLEEDGFDDEEAAPPPIPRLRTTSLGPSPTAHASKSPAASPKRSEWSLRQSAAPSRLATPPARTIVLPYPQYNDLISVPTRAPAPVPAPLRIDTNPAPTPNRYAPPLPNKSPLRTQFEPEPPRPSRTNHARNFSHPFKNQLQSQSQPRYANTSSFRNPPRPLSYRKSSRAPYSLRRWSSLETIDSVQTTQETSRENSFDGSESTRTGTSLGSKRQYLSFDDDDEDEDLTAEDIPTTPPSSSVPLPRTPSDHSRPESSASSSVRSTSTATHGSGSKKSTTASIIRKLKGDKAPEPLLIPESLEIEKRISLDQRSPTNSSTSSMTISGRPSEFAFPGSSHGNTSQLSVSSKDWKSSNFDTSGLSEAELKKCKKKGINPALYAEMKAARKGRFVSPIGGNTFL